MYLGMGMLSGQSVRQLESLDVAAHNVANVDTPGFKTVILTYLHDNSGTKRDLVPTSPREAIDFRQGSTHLTGNPLDMAIMGSGFFVVETPEGEAFTRDGRFTLNEEGELVNLAGYPVMGTGGAVVLDGADIKVDETGRLLSDGIHVDSLRIMSFENPSVLGRADGGLYFDSNDRAGAAESEDSKVVQRALERSNVSAIQEMMKLIDTQRVFESYQKVMLTMQDMDKLSTSRIGRMA